MLYYGWSRLFIVDKEEVEGDEEGEEDEEEEDVS